MTEDQLQVQINNLKQEIAMAENGLSRKGEEIQFIPERIKQWALKKIGLSFFLKFAKRHNV